MALFQPGYYAAGELTEYPTGTWWKKKKAGNVTAPPKNGSVWERATAPASPAPAPNPVPDNKDAQITELNTKLTAATNALNKAQADLQAAQTKAEADLRAKDAVITGLNQTIKAKDGAIQIINDEVKGYQEKISALTLGLKTANDEVLKLQKQIADLTKPVPEQPKPEPEQPKPIPQPEPIPEKPKEPISKVIISAAGNIAGPDESLVIYGQLSGVKKFWVKTEAGKPVEAIIQKLNSQLATITIPAALPYDVYQVWAEDTVGKSNSVYVNKSELWWAKERLTPGQEGYVFGCNLAQDRKAGTNNATVTLEPGSIKAEVLSVNPYSIKYRVPATVKPGSYQVKAHNNHGFGASNQVNIAVVAETKYTGPVISLDANLSDLEALKKAFTTAKNNNNGSVIQLPARALEISTTWERLGGGNFRVQGVAGKTVIRAKEGFAGSYFVIDIFPLSGVEFVDVDFDKNKQNITTKGMFIRGNKNTSYTNCHFHFPGLPPVDIEGSDNTTFTKCTFSGMNNFIGAATQTFLHDCRWRVSDDAGEPVHSFGAEGIAIFNPVCEDYDINNTKTGWGKGRFYVGNNGSSSSRNQYIESYRANKLGVRMIWDTKQNWFVGDNVDPNSSEQILYEGPITKAASTAVSQENNYQTIGFDNIESGLKVGLVKIIRGKGIGQVREIKSVSGNKITVDRPWDEVPDQTSYFVAGHYTYNVAVYNPYCEGKPAIGPHPASNNPKAVTAQSSVQFYGGAYNCMVDGLTAKDLRYGLPNITTTHFDPVHDAHPGLEPLINVYYLNCRIENCAYSIRQDLTVPGKGPTVGASAMVGVVFRRIETINPIDKEFYLNGNVTAPNSSKNMIMEHCTFAKGTAEQESKAGFTDTVYYKNRVGV